MLQKNLYAIYIMYNFASVKNHYDNNKTQKAYKIHKNARNR